METVQTSTSLKQYRKRVLKVTQQVIADRCGFNYQRISQFEMGMRPPEEHAAALAKAYEISIDEFWRLWERRASTGLAASGENGHATGVTGAVAADAGGMSNAGSVA